MKNFYIFLDIDGVLNNRKWIKKCVDCDLENQGYSRFLDPSCIKALNTLTYTLENHFNVIIVLSSLWKLDGVDTVENFLKSHNLKINNTMMQTPNKPNHNRINEIMSFMAHNPIGTNFLVIDDQNLSEHLPDSKFILTTGYSNQGLTIEQVENWLNLNIKEKTF